MKNNNNIINQEKRRLRKFGFTMAIVLSIIGALLIWYNKPAWPYLFSIAGIFLVFAFVLPQSLKPIEWTWIKLAFVIGTISTLTILTLVYYLVMTPIGLLRQLFCKDPLGVKIDKETNSYWKPVDSKGSKSRPYKPY